MNSPDPFPPPTSSDGHPVCRICHDDDEFESALIKPCKCRGSVAFVHQHCLDKCLQKSKNVDCEMCQFQFEYEWVRFKKFSEWTWPQPLPYLSTSFFYVMLVWIGYMLFLGGVFLFYGFSGMMNWIDSHYFRVYEACLVDLFIPYSKAVLPILSKWIADNMVYEFKDRCTEGERRALDGAEREALQCHFCPQGTATASRLILPCRCTHLVHSKCMERIWGTNKIDAVICRSCKVPYKQEDVGFRSISEWNWIGPISDTIGDIFKFYCVLGYTLYFALLLRAWKTTDTNEFWTWMSSHAYWIYWWILVIYSVSYGILSFLVAANWVGENVTRKFKDLGTSFEEEGAEFRENSDVPAQRSAGSEVNERQQKKRKQKRNQRYN